MKEPLHAFNNMSEEHLAFYQDLATEILATDAEPGEKPTGWEKTVEQALVDAQAIAEVRADQ